MSANDAGASLDVQAATGEEIKQGVREVYAARVSGGAGDGAGAVAGLASLPQRTDLIELAGYSPDDVAAVPPDAAAYSFGCGNPLGFSGVKAGDVVLDIGSGAGMDALLAARLVSPSGKVIGLDMTPEMIAKATQNAERARGRQRRVPPGGCRADAGGGCLGGLGDLKLRDQPGT